MSVVVQVVIHRLALWWAFFDMQIHIFYFQTFAVCVLGAVVLSISSVALFCFSLSGTPIL